MILPPFPLPAFWSLLLKSFGAFLKSFICIEACERSPISARFTSDYSIREP